MQNGYLYAKSESPLTFFLGVMADYALFTYVAVTTREEVRGLSNFVYR